MADDPTTDDPAKGDPDKSEPLGDGGKKALDAERKRARDEKKRADDLEARLKELEDKDKSETDRLREENAQLKKDNGELTSAKLRLEVAAEKGVKARWLSGSTREELEAAADEYLTDHPPAQGATPPPTQKPSRDLSGGTDPTEEPAETDPAKLASSVPRL